MPVGATPSPAAGAVINHVAPAPNPKDAGPEVGSFGVNYVLPAVTGAVGARGAGATAPRTSGAAGGGVVRGINRFGGVVSTVTSPAAGAYIAHLPAGPARFADRDQALGALEKALSAEASARARRAGVEEIRLVTEREVSEIQIEGQPMFIEARLRVTAKGRPRIATG